MKALEQKNLRAFYEGDYLRFFGKIDYDDLSVKFGMLKPFLERLDLENRMVLDIGCGLGGMMSKISEKFRPLLIGSDLSLNALGLSPAAQYPRFQSDASNLPVKPGRTELCYFVDLLEHLPDPKDFLKNLFPIAGNLLAFIPMESAFLNNCIHFLRRLLGKKTNLETLGHLHRFNENDIRKMIKSAGFEIIAADMRLYDNFAKLTSFKGRILDRFSSLVFKVAPPLHRKLFGGWAFIALLRGGGANV